jgi:hypothetical protein
LAAIGGFPPPHLQVFVEPHCPKGNPDTPLAVSRDAAIRDAIAAPVSFASIREATCKSLVRTPDDS